MTKEWLKAFGFVLGGAAVLGFVGYKLGHPFVGIGLGIGTGMAINYKRECPVCMAHLAALRAGTGV